MTPLRLFTDEKLQAPLLSWSNEENDHVPVEQVEYISQLCYGSLLNQFESWEEKKSELNNRVASENSK